MSDLGHDVSTVVTGMASDLSRETAKMANESVKQMLIFLINKAREQGDRPGEKSLKKLLQSSNNDEVKLFDLEHKHIKAFAERAKKYQFPYAMIEDQERHSVFYRGSDEVRVKAVIESLLEKELTAGNNENKKISALPVNSDIQKSDHDFEVVGDHHIKVNQAILDVSKPVERSLAEQEGVKVEEVLDLSKEKLAAKQPDETEIRTGNVVLDLEKPVQRTLAREEGVDVRSFVEHLRIPEPHGAAKEVDLDERYNKAVQLAKEEAEITIPKLQSELNVGYSEARRLVDRMEEEGLVTPYDGSRPQQYIGDRPKEPEQVQQVFSDQAKDQPMEIHSPRPEQSVLYEHVDGTKIRVPSVTLDMEKPEHRELAESYGIKVTEIDFKRETSDLRIEKAEVRGKESLNERLVALPEREHHDQHLVVQEFFRNVEGRLSLDERRDQIRPMMAAAKESAPAKNKTKERGGR